MEMLASAGRVANGTASRRCNYIKSSWHSRGSSAKTEPLMPTTSALQRLAVFIDYQNAYRGARRAFGSGDAPHIVGQFDPLKIARAIAQRHPSYSGAKLRSLVSVVTYRGLPGANRDPTGYAAARKQIAKWNRTTDPNGITPQVRTRPLAYGINGPREKGIDVLLALDLAFAAAEGQFDVVVLFSGDSDLLPALERASQFNVVCETAMWQGGNRQLPKTDYIQWEHRLTRLDYENSHDSFDYRPNASRRSPRR